ncbi:MAG: hypothetical protein LBT11_02910 [Treponema sp.]|nr:hypothetical protein [Treponema sp.]
MAEEQSLAERESLNPDGEAFPRIDKRLEETPQEVFNDPNYYKAVLSGEGEAAQPFHTALQKYVNAKEEREREEFKQQLIPAYWNFLPALVKKTGRELPGPKKYFLRFGMVHPAFISAEARDLLARVVVDNKLGVPVYYLDEWFRAVGSGALKTSAVDEVRIPRSAANNSRRLQQLLEQYRDNRDGVRSVMGARHEERLKLEKILRDRTGIALEHHPLEEVPGMLASYTGTQKQYLEELPELSRSLLKVAHEQELIYRDYFHAVQQLRTIQAKIDGNDDTAPLEDDALDTEFETVRRMAKLSVGRNGNHFPLLGGEYFHSLPADLGSRENVVSLLAWVESLDPGIFRRSYKQRLNRIVPCVLLLPCYGNTGLCWEPFDRFNRATSRGRLVVPMYPRNLQIAVLTAAADLRWQAAKEKASYYWMEEGLTGYYFQWFQKMRIRGDIKDLFIQDYISWITKESEGIQKLDKEVRAIFWQHLPFPKPLREKLRDRSYVYQDLYQKAP